MKSSQNRVALRPITGILRRRGDTERQAGNRTCKIVEAEIEIVLPQDQELQEVVDLRRGREGPLSRGSPGHWALLILIQTSSIPNCERINVCSASV